MKAAHETSRHWQAAQRAWESLVTQGAPQTGVPDDMCMQPGATRGRCSGLSCCSCNALSIQPGAASHSCWPGTAETSTDCQQRAASVHSFLRHLGPQNAAQLACACSQTGSGGPGGTAAAAGAGCARSGSQRSGASSALPLLSPPGRTCTRSKDGVWAAAGSLQAGLCAVRRSVCSAPWAPVAGAGL